MWMPTTSPRGHHVCQADGNAAWPAAAIEHVHPRTEVREKEARDPRRGAPREPLDRGRTMAIRIEVLVAGCAHLAFLSMQEMVLLPHAVMVLHHCLSSYANKALICLPRAAVNNPNPSMKSERVVL